jgi:hypothetical protein
MAKKRGEVATFAEVATLEEVENDVKDTPVSGDGPPPQLEPDLVGQPTSSAKGRHDDPGDEPVLDRAAIDRDIANGAKAFRELLSNAALDWTRWSATILGLRGLRALAFAKAGSNNMRSQAFRDAIGSLLRMHKYSIYDRIDRQARSDCYRLMDRLEEVDAWYAHLSVDEKMRWKHPSTIVKHCPRQYLSGGMRWHNRPAGKKKPAISFETERLKALLIQVIKRLIKYEPDAAQLLDQVIPSDPDDDIGDLAGSA